MSKMELDKLVMEVIEDDGPLDLPSIIAGVIRESVSSGVNGDVVRAIWKMDMDIRESVFRLVMSGRANLNSKHLIGATYG